MRYNKFMEGKNLNLKPQDVIVILKVLSKGKVPWRISDLAYELDLSAGEVSNCLGRLKACALISNDKKTPMVTNLKEFLLYGLRYTFPARLGKNERGVLTTCNYIAREYGLHSAMPTKRAMQLCKDLVVVPFNIEKYKKESNEIFKIFKCYS